MVVSRKQEWDHQPEETATFSTTCLPRANAVLKTKCVIMIIMVAVILMAITVQSEAIIRAGYDLVQMKTQLAVVEKDNELLRLDIAKLKSPHRIQTIATNELGMILPQNVYCATGVAAPNGTATAVDKDKTVIGQVIERLKAAKVEASKGQ